MLPFVHWLLLITLCVWADDAPSGFADGVKAYKNDQFEKARQAFTPLVAEHPDNPALLYNLGLAEYQLGQYGMALGLWRKARYLNSDFTAAQMAIDFTEEQLFPNKREQSFIVSIYNSLKSLPLWLWLACSFLTFFFTSYFSLEYGVKKKFSIGLWPTWIFFVFPIFLISSFFAANLFISSQKKLATVVPRDLMTRANPSESSPTMNELDEGQVVTVEKVYGPWAQIRTQSGTPGWVPQQSIIIFKGR